MIAAPRLVIVNYGMGNIGSVVNAFRRLGAECEVSDSPNALRDASAVILPGVGAFGAAMKNLRDLRLDDALDRYARGRKPFFGICLGMQLLATSSEELGFSTGLGWIDAPVLRLHVKDDVRIPHVGWNDVALSGDSPLFHNIQNAAHFYFDHSYHLACGPEVTMATCEYGGTWTAAIQDGLTMAVQFHPEKSQRVGLKLLRNFLNLVEAS